MKRLYNDAKRMDADDMRDNAAILDGALQEIRECPLLTDEQMRAEREKAEAELAKAEAELANTRQVLLQDAQVFSQKATHRAKAQQMWEAFTANERTGVRFGMFPAAAMQVAEKEGLWNMHELTCALMDVADKKGGMKA